VFSLQVKQVHGFTSTHHLMTDSESHLILWPRRARLRKRKRLFNQLMLMDQYMDMSSILWWLQCK